MSSKVIPRQVKISSSENPTSVVPPEPKKDTVPYRLNDRTIIMVKRGISEEELQKKIEKYKDMGSILRF